MFRVVHATFTYHSSKAWKVINLFKQTDMKLAFKSTKALQQMTKPKTHDTTEDHDKASYINWHVKHETGRT